ncbi:MAG: energy-coupling factor ABC transporter permease [Candidatus Omnitrophica bacterium]|nr:energy-coupling factor ABC transporter permease [Candidatus Omnitrophota bacterium]
MHIPNEMLNGTICPVTAAVSAVGIVGAAVAAVKSKERPKAARFGAVAALIFSGQMMNFPIQNGTSGHLLGGVLASALLGTPFGILAMALVVSVQCLLFSDGGFSVLGANVLNMAVIGAGLGGILRSKRVRSFPFTSLKRIVSVGSVAWISVVAAAFACSLELAVAGTIDFSKVAVSMLGTHALIGIGEALITLSAYYLFAEETYEKVPEWIIGAPLLASGLIAGLLSPFASGFPDGLEWVAEKYQFLHEAAPAFASPMPDYAVAGIPVEALSTGLAGMIGVFATFLLGWAVAAVVTCFSLKRVAA